MTAMSNQEKLIRYLERQQWVIDKQSEGLSHADSVLQLPFRSNRFNWVLGHIVVYRDKMLTLLQASPVLETDESAIYQRGSEPLSADEDNVEIERLLKSSQESLERLIVAIQSVSDEFLGDIFDEQHGTTILDRLEFLLWHENYHLGQLEILRQLAGKDDEII